MNADRRLHLVLGTLLCFVVPALSWVDGSGRLAYGMFADVVWYRIELVAQDARGVAFAISPTELALQVRGTGAALFAGADRFHLGVRSHTAHDRLEDIARFACEVRADAREVTVTLSERRRPEGAIETRSATRVCAR